MVKRRLKYLRALVVLFVLVSWELSAQVPPALLPPKRSLAPRRASGIPVRTFRAAILRAPLQKAVEIHELSLQLGTGIVEATEVLGVRDSELDCPCMLDLRLAKPVKLVSWRKSPKKVESEEDAAIRAASSDVEDSDDHRFVSQLVTPTGRPDIKIVGRIDYCPDKKGLGHGPAQLNSTRFYGCAFENETFMVSDAILGQCDLRGFVIAHEYGHNAGNEHDPSSIERVLVPSSAKPAKSRQVTTEQCAKYLNWTRMAEYGRRSTRLQQRQTTRKSQ